MVLTVLTFAIQDGFSRLLAGNYNTLMVVMIRYWVFGAFVMAMALRRPEGTSRGNQHHAISGPIPCARCCWWPRSVVMVWGYTLIGLINAHAVFAVCPLIIVALSGADTGGTDEPAALAGGRHWAAWACW